MAKPADAADIDAWLFHSKKNRQFVLGPDGSMLILDPKTGEVAKTIPFKRGVDALTVLAGSHPELRAAAEEKMLIHSVSLDDIAPLEQELLKAVDDWEASKTPAYALAVAKAQQALDTAMVNYRAAQYPHRKVKELTLLKRDLDYRTKDERALPYRVGLGTYATTTAVERALPIVVDTA